MSKKVYARFFWQQTGRDRYRLLLTNPLGSTELSLTAQPGSVQLIDNKGQTYTATDAEEMIGRLTGMPIPLNSLRQWIIGLPGDATDYSLDDRYRLRELNYTQNGKTPARDLRRLHQRYPASPAVQCRAEQWRSAHQAEDG